MVIYITEAKPNNIVFDTEVLVDDYNIVKNDRKKKVKAQHVILEITFVLTGKPVSLTT